MDPLCDFLRVHRIETNSSLDSQSDTSFEPEYPVHKDIRSTLSHSSQIPVAIQKFSHCAFVL